LGVAADIDFGIGIPLTGICTTYANWHDGKGLSPRRKNNCSLQVVKIRILSTITSRMGARAITTITNSSRSFMAHALTSRAKSG